MKLIINLIAFVILIMIQFINTTSILKRQLSPIVWSTENKM
jgi:hypothetical protein